MVRTLGRSWALVVLAMALTAAGDAWAQSKTTAGLTGTVLDDSGAALPGATVTISSPQLIGGARTVVTDDQGGFRFREIAPGAYAVEVSLDGFQTTRVENVTLALGSTTDVPVKLAIAQLTETLTVVAEAAVIDPTSSGTSTNLTNEYLQNLPTGRFQPDVLNYAPGINLDVAFGTGTGAANAYQIDGIDTSDPEGGTPWSFVNYNIIDEVQLVGLGAPAEYGSFTGIVFNSVTKSGSNEIKGLAEALYSGESLADEFSGDELAGLNPRLESQVDATVQFGGPITQDKLWYFLSAQYFKDESSNGGPIRTEESPRAFGKLSWQLNEKHNLETWVEWDRYDITGRGADAVTPLEATVTEDAPELVWNVALRSVLSANTIVSLTYGGYDGYYYLDPAEGYDTAGRYDGHTGLYSTNSYYYYLADRTRNQVNASLSHYADDFIKGDHEFKFGMEIERSTVRSRYGYPTGAWFYDNYGYFYDDPGTEEYDGGYYTLGYYNYSYDLDATIERGSVFAQDAWKVTPHLTLNVGFRGEVNHGTVKGDGKIFDNTALAPRLGFAWDATHDGKTVVKGHYGRFFEKFVATQFYFARQGSFTPLEQKIIYPSGFVESLGQARAGVTVIDDDLDQPYLDQYTLGVDREIPGGITLSGTLIYRKKEDFIETVSRDGIFVPVTGVVRETGQTITLFDYMNPETDVLVYRNVPQLFREYKGVMLTATKRLRDNWQMMASYVYSETEGNVDNLGTSSTYGGDNPSRFLDTPNSLVNAEGKLTHDQTHQVKLQGTYVIPAINLSLSGNYTYYTGDTYMARSNCLLVDGDCYDFNQGSLRFFAEPRGARRLDPKNELDLRAEWFYDLANQTRLGVFVDIFNVTNDERATVVEDRTGSAFETARSANLPRSYRVGLRVNF
jgi:hypothetical protein